MECPWCKSTNTYAEFVDVGIGSEQVTPYTCNDCGACQINPHFDCDNADEDEKKYGWYRPMPLSVEEEAV